MYTLNDFFCGCGGLGLGFQNAGFKIVGAWDFDKYAVATYRENVGDHVVQADIQKMCIEDVPKADVWVSLPGLKRSRKTGGYKAGMCRLRYRMGSVRGNLQRRKFMSGLRWHEPQGSDQKRYVF